MRNVGKSLAIPVVSKTVHGSLFPPASFKLAFSGSYFDWKIISLSYQWQNFARLNHMKNISTFKHSSTFELNIKLESACDEPFSGFTDAEVTVWTIVPTQSSKYLLLKDILESHIFLSNAPSL